MKRRVRSIGSVLLIFLLCIISFAGTLISAGEGQVNPLNFGVAGMDGNRTVAPSLLYESFFGCQPTDAERDYLDTLSGISLSYSSTVPESVVSTVYNGEAGTLEVTVQPYRYLAANGITVSWIPVSAEIDGRLLPLTAQDGVYQCLFGDLFHSEDFEMKIDFSCQLDIPASEVDQIYTVSYVAGAQALQSILAYEEALALHRAAQERFAAYQAYLEAERAYASYLEKYEAYEEAMRLYEQYEQDCVTYEQTLAAYEAWQHYYEYQDFLVNGLEAYQSYLQYRQQVDRVVALLDVMERLFVCDSNGWQLYGSLLGDTVATVVARKDELVAAGCNAADIDAAGASTVVLRALMEEYAKLRVAKYTGDHARISTLFAFYTKNYTSLRDNFAKLTGALTSLSENDLVIYKLRSEGKLDRYRQFVGQLYITATVLDDSVLQSPSWKMREKDSKTLFDVVEACHRVTDSNTATPDGVQMPEKEVAAVEAVTPIEKPTVPYVKDPPVLPPTVDKPTEPDKVDQPDVVPEEADPGAEPSEPAIDARLRALASEIREGTLTERTARGEAKTLDLSHTMAYPVSIRNLMTVTFYDMDGVTILDRQTLEYGSAVEYRGPATQKESDAQYHYQFVAWMLPDGNPAEMVATRNLTLQAMYRKSIRFYKVTWCFENHVRTLDVAYGVMPTSPYAVTEKAPDEGYSYVFSGWDKEIVPVTGDVTYTGYMIPIPHLFQITWDLGTHKVTQEFAYGTLPVFEGDTSRAPDSYLYDFAGWAEPIVPVKRDKTYTASYRKTPLAQASDGRLLDVLHGDGCVTVIADDERVDVRQAVRYARSIGSTLEVAWDQVTARFSAEALLALEQSPCRTLRLIKTQQGQDVIYDFGYYNSIGGVIREEIAAELICKNRVSDIRLSGFVKQGDGWTALQDATHEAIGGATLMVRQNYSIRVIENENCNLSLLPSRADVGDLIDLRIGCVFGYEVSGAKVTLADGTAVDLQDLTFYMPNGEVTIELNVTPIVYHVVFRVDGVVISERNYGLGEAIQLPENPTKQSDGTYAYVFTGWSSSATVAMGDAREMVYDAIFNSSLLTEEDPYKSGNNNNTFITVVLPIAGVGVVVLVAGILLLRYILKKRRIARYRKYKMRNP